MSVELPDWERLQKALSVEIKNGFVDLKGKQFSSFSEFIKISLLSKTPQILSTICQKQWQQLANQFDRYPYLTINQRQELVEVTVDFLVQMQRICEQKLANNNYVINPNNNISQVAENKNNLLINNNIDNKQNIVEEKNHQEINQEIPVNKNLTAKPSNINNTSGQPKNNNGLLEEPLLKLSGIGTVIANLLAKLGLYTVQDLLYYYPRDYIDYANQVNIKELQGGETVTIVGKVKRCSCFTSPRNKKLNILELVISDRTGQIKLSRFYAGNYSTRWQELQKRMYSPGAIVAASGLVKKTKYGVNLDKLELEVLSHPGDNIESMTIGKVVPVYPLTEGVGANVVRKAVIAALPAAQKIQDPLPAGLRDYYGLIPLSEAITNIHLPANPEILSHARRRLVFDEFFYLQLGLLKRKATQRKVNTNAILAPQGKLIEQFYQILPFKLTNAQQRVISEILKDLAKSEPMNRLVQGDVGAGKTVVAVVAMLAAIQAGYQAALMAPTEVLAEQHYHKLVSWFNLLHLPVELLTGSTKTAKRRQIYAELATGELPVLVGTHALIQDNVNFHRLGLAVIDEQHRFGVQQRARLQQKGVEGVPHVLTMTATPIPRTLALTLHGDLDVSQIDELPPGRQAIQTTALSGRERSHAYDLIRREVANGRQVYVVLPLIEESEKLDLRSAIEEHQKLQDSIFPDFQVGLLHGRMSSAEKEEAINKFRNNETQILVSTTVVEVGVDVPNATVMLIENAERFGLSQLHQLRGRVGRGADRSYCLLMSHSNATEDAYQRLKVLESSQDGFFIAEMDMRLRGPGEVLGTRQSGLADFALASLVADQAVLELAREAAEKVIAKDESLMRWPNLKFELEERYKKLMGGALFT